MSIRFDLKLQAGLHDGLPRQPNKLILFPPQQLIDPIITQGDWYAPFGVNHIDHSAGAKSRLQAIRRTKIQLAFRYHPKHNAISQHPITAKLRARSNAP
ncbi:hypothetical protein D3C80_1903810 [compost metagenome]